MGLVVGLVLVVRGVGKEMAATGIPLQGVRGGLVVTRAALCVPCGRVCHAGNRDTEIRVAGIKGCMYVQLY